MLSYIIKRILSLIPTLFVVSVVVFLVVYMIPGAWRQLQKPLQI